MNREEKREPRVGVPWRSTQEEAEKKRPKIEAYLDAVRTAGGEPVFISFSTPPGELERLTGTLDAIVLPGSPADVDPKRYGATRHPKCENPDPSREQTDYALLDHAFAAGKPVLAICYGLQLLNVYLGGSLVQDIRSELSAPLKHDWSDRASGAPEPFHPVCIEAPSQLAVLAKSTEGRVNSSHHQAIREPGRGLRVAAHAPDGVIEAVEWTGDANWVVGVQWHPERMHGDPFTVALFRALVAAARAASAAPAEKSRGN